MIAIIELIDQFELWIYGLLVVLGLVQAVLFWQAWRQNQLAAFNLVREITAAQMTRSMVLVVLLVVIAGLVFLNARYVAPNIPVIFNVAPTLAPVTPPTPEPTATSPVIIPGLPTPTPGGTPTLRPSSTPVPVGGAGCSNPLATIRSPLPGAVLGGEVEVLGTADIPNFAFYVMEISTLGENWLVVYTGSTPVRDDVLGIWNAGLQPPGDYAFRLVVFDATGANPDPCTIPITIGN